MATFLESFVKDGERANDEENNQKSIDWIHVLISIDSVEKNISFHGHHQKMAGYKVSNIRWDGKKTDQAPVNNQLQKSVRLALLLHTIQDINWIATYKDPPSNPTHTSAVKIPAPARSAPVIARAGAAASLSPPG